MESMKEKLTEYAQLLVRVGLNIQRGQPLVISSPVECAFFARLCAAEAYQAGCREVVMNWGDDELGRMKYLHAADDASAGARCELFRCRVAYQGTAFGHAVPYGEREPDA